MSTIDDVVEAARTTYSFLVPAGREAVYNDFLQRQIDTYSSQYNFHFTRNAEGIFNNLQPHLWLMVDTLLLFSYLMRDREVSQDKYHQSPPTRVDTFHKICLLRSRGNSAELWVDMPLYHLSERRERGNKGHKLPTYKEIFQELGKDPAVVKLWGRELDYDKDFTVWGRK